MAKNKRAPAACLCAKDNHKQQPRAYPTHVYPYPACSKKFAHSWSVKERTIRPWAVQATLTPCRCASSTIACCSSAVIRSFDLRIGRKGDGESIVGIAVFLPTLRSRGAAYDERCQGDRDRAHTGFLLMNGCIQALRNACPLMHRTGIECIFDLAPRTRNPVRDDSPRSPLPRRISLVDGLAAGIGCGHLLS
jgi:hypothetical protein